MSERKTVRIFATVGFNGDDLATSIHSMTELLSTLEAQALSGGREPLFETLDISAERSFVEERTLVGDTIINHTITTITGSVEAVKR